MGFWLVVLLVLAPLIVLLAVSRNQRRLSAERAATVRLEVGPLGVRRELASGRVEEVHWDELTEVEVLPARTGPYREAGGVVILFGDEERGCLVPIDRVADTELVGFLQALPGFSVPALLEALQGQPGRRVSVWSPTEPG